MYQRYFMTPSDELEALEPWPDDEDDPDLDDDLDDDLADLGEVFRGSLDDAYAHVSPEAMEEALLNVYDTLTPAESFNLTKALGQIEKAAGQALRDPTVGQIARVALPVAGGAAGTLVGGPAGTAIGSGLGTAAAKALPAGAKARPKPAAPITPALAAAVTPAPAAVPPPAKPPVAGGSAAATQGLILTQHPQVLQSLLALALGEHGRKSVDGVPVGAVMNLLSSVFGQAAADADELLAASDELPAYLLDGEGQLQADPAAPADRARALYAALLDAEDQDLADVVGR